MQIACPQCATNYELDERLLPPTGAPVQCTRCSHVFTAVPPVDDNVRAPRAMTPAGGIPEGTQLYGGGMPTRTPAIGTAIPEGTQLYGGPKNTQLFGAVPAPEPTAPESRPTQVFGAVSAPEPASQAVETQIDAPTPEAESSAPPLGGRRRTPAASTVLDPFDPPGLDDPEPEVALASSIRRRRNVALIALGAVVLGVAALAGYRWWSTGEAALPAEATELHGTATTLLRRDDPKSLDQAVAQLDRVLTRWPNHFEARVTQLMALLFQLDDARMQITRLNVESEALSKQISKLQARQSPSDWQNRANALRERLQELKKRSDPLIDRASALDARVNKAFQELQQKGTALSPEQDLAFVRAQAMYYGVKGADQAIVLSERYRQQGGADGWAEVAYAEYALNARVPPETRTQAQEGLEAVRSKDASFIRPWVLSGRLMLANKAPDAAVSAFEAATALNPAHTVASDLLKSAQRARAEAAADN